jgi:hypothetical protein
MRSLIFGAVLTGMAALAGCARTQTKTTTSYVTVPDSFVRPSNGQTALAPVARGTIRLGEVDTAGALPTAPSAPTAIGGGPPASDNTKSMTSVGPMSPTTITGADSPLDGATTAGTAGGQPGNPLTTGSATLPAGPNSHGGTPSPHGR